MIIRAGMFMNEAGLVPSIIELSSSDPKASAIPMAVAAFICNPIGGAAGFFNLGMLACTNRRGGRSGGES
jgi:hypothetical protein